MWQNRLTAWVGVIAVLVIVVFWYSNGRTLLPNSLSGVLENGTEAETTDLLVLAEQDISQLREALTDPSSEIFEQSFGYYTQLFLKESGAVYPTVHVFDQTYITGFLDRHRGAFVSAVPADAILISEHASMEGYRHDLRLGEDGLRPINSSQISSVIIAQEPISWQVSLAPVRDALDHNITVLQGVPVPTETVDTHKRYLATSVAMRNAVQQLSEGENDIIGSLLAARAIDSLGEQFLAWRDQNGIEPYFLSERQANEDTLAVALNVFDIKIARDGSAEVFTPRQVAGATTECGFCLPVDRLLEAGAQRL